jgi:hypothetical protein
MLRYTLGWGESLGPLLVSTVVLPDVAVDPRYPPERHRVGPPNTSPSSLSVVVMPQHPKSSAVVKIWTVYLYFRYSDMDSILIIWASDDLKWKSLNYKVTDLNKSYTFHIKFIFIRVHTKRSWVFKRSCPYRQLKRRLEPLQYRG